MEKIPGSPSFPSPSSIRTGSIIQSNGTQYSVTACYTPQELEQDTDDLVSLTGASHHLQGPPSHLWQEVNNMWFLWLPPNLNIHHTCPICSVPGYTGCYSVIPHKNKALLVQIIVLEFPLLTYMHSCQHGSYGSDP